MPNDVEETLADRGKEYGDYKEMCAIIQRLKRAMHQSLNWESLTHTQTEALEMCATKIGRILTGNPNNPDSWKDIAGYATKAYETLPTAIINPRPACVVCGEYRIILDEDDTCVDCCH